MKFTGDDAPRAVFPYVLNIASFNDIPRNYTFSSIVGLGVTGGMGEKDSYVGYELFHFELQSHRRWTYPVTRRNPSETP